LERFRTSPFLHAKYRPVLTRSQPTVEQPWWSRGLFGPEGPLGWLGRLIGMIATPREPQSKPVYDFGRMRRMQKMKERQQRVLARMQRRSPNPNRVVAVDRNRPPA
jgi:hypothetical protein